MFTAKKYPTPAKVSLDDRQWPNQRIEAAPMWCSVDLRDGNQALVDPMTVEQKMRLFLLLVDMGFKHIEVGFPAASQPDFDFVRRLIEEQKIPEDVVIQVLVQCRESLIERTFEALKGAKKAIVHIYNSTSVVQREQVFKLDKQAIKAIAVEGAVFVKSMAEKAPETEWSFQYSPESFTGTEVEYAVEVCNAVIDVWQPSKNRPCIINLPATVEMTSPNVYADQIEYFCRHVKSRDAIIVSLHTHNDRGCGVAAAELGLMAGADRLEGTLLGNGERTGNMDIVTAAMNLYSQGIEPELDLSQMDHIIATVEACTAIKTHPRHPYAGELVFTAFSGSHQDAINKCLSTRSPDEVWQVAYLPIDPADIGRDYQAVIRINSQSGKGGVAFLLEQQYGLQLPRWMQIDFSGCVQRLSEELAKELSSDQIWQAFCDAYLAPTPLKLEALKLEHTVEGESVCVTIDHVGQKVQGRGDKAGSLEILINVLQDALALPIKILEYQEHAVTAGAESNAVAYVLLSIHGQRYAGAGLASDILGAVFSAALSATNNYMTREQLAA